MTNVIRKKWFCIQRYSIFIEMFFNIYSIGVIRTNFMKCKNMKKDNSNVEVVISSLKPAVFWKDKPILIEQSKKWNKGKLQAALKKTKQLIKKPKQFIESLSSEE